MKQYNFKGLKIDKCKTNFQINYVNDITFDEDSINCY